MSVRAPLIAGTVLSLAAVSAWSYVASLAIGPAAPLHLGRNLLSDYAQLASAPAGNGAELFTVVAAIYAAFLLVDGWRQQRRGGLWAAGTALPGTADLSSPPWRPGSA